jgi:riboflavin kinase/FMN adenylyltransferase
VELLHKLHDELRTTASMPCKAGIARDCDDARAFFASTHAETRRQTTRDRI